MGLTQKKGRGNVPREGGIVSFSQRGGKGGGNAGGVRAGGRRWLGHGR